MAPFPILVVSYVVFIQRILTWLFHLGKFSFYFWLKLPYIILNKSLHIDVLWNNIVITYVTSPSLINWSSEVFFFILFCFTDRIYIGFYTTWSFLMWPDFLCPSAGPVDRGNDSPCTSSDKCLLGRLLLDHPILVKKSDPPVLSGQTTRSCSLFHLNS